MKEYKQYHYVIWGIAPGKTEEEVIFTKATSKEEAQKYMKIFTEQYGMTEGRIQVIDMSECPSKMFKSREILNV